MEILIENILELPGAAKQLLKFSSGTRIFLFEGDMGAGKTTFIKALCAELVVEDTVSSPTYSIVNEYIYPKGKVYHFDFYRIKSEIEAYDLGFEEYLCSNQYCFIEWPERIKGLWPETYIQVAINQTKDKERTIIARKF